jgi:hypothetical protein
MRVAWTLLRSATSSWRSDRGPRVRFVARPQAVAGAAGDEPNAADAATPHRPPSSLGERRVRALVARMDVAHSWPKHVLERADRGKRLSQLQGDENRIHKPLPATFVDRSPLR